MRVSIFGTVPSNWELTTIGTLVSEGKADVQTGPFGTMLKASSYREVGTPVIPVKNIIDNKVIEDDIPRIGEEDRQRLERYSLKEGDIIFGRKGGVDRRAFIGAERAGWIQGSDCIRLRFLTNLIDSKFISYLFGTQNYKNWILQNAEGTTMPSLNQSIINRIQLVIPPLKIQRRIVEIFTSIEEKIEVNNRINQTLEEMANILFKNWFVDFSPFQEFNIDETELGKIPKGWEVKKVGENIRLMLGGTPSRKKAEYWNGEIPWINSGKVNEFRIVAPSEYITDEGLKKSATKLLPKGTTVLAITGATLGQISRLEIEACANQSVIGFLENEYFSSEYIYLWLNNVIDELTKQQTGGAHQHINKGNVEDLYIILPNCNVRKKFQLMVEPMFAQISINCLENENLKQTRDYLLPRLLSGASVISVIEKQVEEVL